jgi:sodium-dependent dicarboxylate transporter 2/3/5
MSAHNVNTDSPDEIILQEEEPQGPVQSGRSIIMKVLLSLGLGLLVYLIPMPESLPPAGHKFLGLVVAIIALWVTEAVPIGVTALCAASGLILFGIQSANKAWSPFSSPAVMFVLMIIMFGVVLNEVGLANRIMSWVFKLAGRGVKRLSFVMAFSCTMLATFLHDATVTVIMLFALVPVLRAMGITPAKSNNLSKFFIILIPLAASAGGFGTLLGGGRNPLAVEILAKYTNGAVNVGFLEYMMIQFPLSIFTAIATWVVVYMIFRPKEKELPAAVAVDQMPPMRGKELAVCIIFGLAFLLWGFSDLTGWHVTVVAALALAGFCGPKFISFKTICDKFPWESWIVFGAGVSMGQAMLDSGAGKFLAEQFLPLLQGQNPFLVYYGMGFFGSFLSSMMSNSAAVALTLPVTLPMAEMLNMSPQAVALLAPITTSFIMLVIGCPPTIIAYSTGYFSQTEFIKVAVPWCLVLLLLSVISVLVYWPMIGFY